MNTTQRNILAALVGVIVCICILPSGAHAALPPEDSLLHRADSLRGEYLFSDSAELIEKAMQTASDSIYLQTLGDRLLMARNGESMMHYCSDPVVIARRKFSINDFFLYYPLEDGAWRPLPNVLDSTASDGLSKGMYIPSNASTLYYSAKDENNIRNIYKTFFRDSLWAVPELVNETMTSSSDDIYPMVSPNGKELYFASEGLYGVGGFDLYVSKWNEDLADWDTPVNMGFPYCSPYDDFLYINSEDGKYSIFASNRECGKDSVCVYVLEYDSMPVRKAVTDPGSLKTLCSLEPENDPSRMDNNISSEENENNPETLQYIACMNKVGTLRDSIARLNDDLDKYRTRLGMATDSVEIEFLKQEVLSKEAGLPILQDSLNAAGTDLLKIEMDFLDNGRFIDFEKVKQNADREVVGANTSYTFTKKNMGSRPDFTVEKPKPVFDYSFKVLSEGRFAEDNTIPDGIVYQIRIFSLSSKATLRMLKGLSPVFEQYLPNKKMYAYSAGVFRTYKDALSNLNTVKKTGFRTAFIVAYKDGETIPVIQARKLENTVVEMFRVRITPGNGVSLPENIIASMSAMSGKDVVMLNDNDSVSYITGPFSGVKDAEVFVSQMKALGVNNISIEKIESN